ncbi:MAG: sigma-70 family RNA polymerase sigma factor, partial [Butyrivibrio sp.]|nr:sigma-70 family RNA polymerase sigma factor [Butyrivibrio sp.]
LSRKKSQFETNSLDNAIIETTYSEIRYENIESDIDFNLLLSKLTDKQRELIILRYEHDLTLKEIAEITGSNLRTCQSNLRKALKQIEKNLERSKEDE